MIYRINFKKQVYRIFVIFAFSLFLLSQTVESLESTSSIELEGNIVPISTLSLISYGQKLESEKDNSGSITLNYVDALGLHSNPIGKVRRSSQSLEAYYQTDLVIRTQISGSSSPAKVIVAQTDSGPLKGLLYEEAQNFDITQANKLQPIPQFPQFKVAISNIQNGIHDHNRQIILRVPSNLSEGPKSALLQYVLEVTP